MEKYVLEACVDSVESALAAWEGGATRLELCSDLIVGGTTPSPCLFREIRSYVETRIHVLIRPRFGDFCYTDYETKVMEEEIQMFCELGAEGIVVGALEPDGALDMEKMERFVRAAKGRWVTLHRAFDVCRDPYQSLNDAERLGVSCVLTSGQKNNALEGKELLRDLNKRAEGRIQILAGGGIDAETIEKLYDTTKITAYHMSGKIVLDSPMKYRRGKVSMGLPGFSEYEMFRTSKEKVEDARKILESLK
ncbi:MAG: copper homeostasis protein CutC [Lachnospiraceae bacterium]|nr:copper homeostasis protein CutC [Robinsoniella sp.]MDY3766437.1 copper homeostasis protein CutC [Lachnospiraceae bacterium]